MPASRRTPPTAALAAVALVAAVVLAPTSTPTTRLVELLRVVPSCAPETVAEPTPHSRH